jgi:hypothetical protein
VRPSRYRVGSFFSNPAKNLDNFREDFPRGGFGVDVERDLKKHR